MKSRIWLSLAHMSGREQEFIQEAFDTNWVVPLGPNVNAFEQSLRDFLIENGELKIENEDSVRNSKISDTFQTVGCFEGKLKLKLYVTL